MSDKLSVYRASILHFLFDPTNQDNSDSYQFFEDGILIVIDGKIDRIGQAEELLKSLPKDISIIDYRGKLIIPGFIDAHIHYPQTDMIASYGEQLLTWLNKYTFPTEQKFDDDEYATEVSQFFIDELLRNGTTSAQVLATIHPGSVEAIFNVAQSYQMRLIAGKVMMDRNAPSYLLDTPDSSYQQSKSLIEKWHGKDRLLYAITPRFAPTSSEAQFEKVKLLAEEFETAYIHSHVAENSKEIAWVAELFPECRSYLDVYDHYQLLRERSVFAHGIHLDDHDLGRMADSGAAIAFCPTSNTFLGSGLFNYQYARNRDIRVGLATDVGAGTSFSMFKTLSEAYKVQQLLKQTLSPLRAIYLGTLGSAQALYLEEFIGNFEKGKEADFIVLDYSATELIKRRLSFAKNLQEKLFILIMLGDDRLIDSTYILGKQVYQNASN